MKVVIMVGKPASGKTTIAKRDFKDLIWLNQDDIGSKQSVMTAMNQFLERGESVIVDRCNQSVKQRATLTKIARMYGASVHAVYLDAPTELCVKRANARKGHPTIVDMGIAQIRKIVNKFQSELQVPTLEEDFDTIMMVKVRE